MRYLTLLEVLELRRHVAVGWCIGHSRFRAVGIGSCSAFDDLWR
jgi:hypothetical protein